MVRAWETRALHEIARDCKGSLGSAWGSREGMTSPVSAWGLCRLNDVPGEHGAPERAWHPPQSTASPDRAWGSQEAHGDRQSMAT